MRLIDADKLRLVKCGEHDSGKPINCVYEWAIKDAPTVEAIPIEWIEQYLEIQYPIESPYGTKSYFHDFMTRMIKDWRKENG